MRPTLLAQEIHRLLGHALPRQHASELEAAVHADLSALLNTNRMLKMGGAAVLGTLGVVQGAALAASPVANNTDPAMVSNNSVLLLGMNQDSRYELEALVRATGDLRKLTYIGPGAEADVVELKGQRFDLSAEADRALFAAQLGLQGERLDAFLKLLADTGANAKDELGRVAMVLAEAEGGKRLLDRVVLSGHSVGSTIWGDGNGSIAFSNLARLGAVFPRALAQVQDLMLAACYSGGESRMDNYRAIFPNLKTIWAYDGSAPGSVSGAAPHLVRWERGTRGASSDALRREAADGTRKGENVAVWTVTRGYDNGRPPAPLEDVRAAYLASAPVLAPYLSGERAVEDPQQGELRAHYNDIQRMLGRRDLPADERAALEGERDLVIRLLFWKNVSAMFQATHGARLQAGLAELGLEVPDVGALSRQDALALVARFDRAYAGVATPPARLRFLNEILHDGLVGLQPKHIPEAWI